MESKPPLGKKRLYVMKVSRVLRISEQYAKNRSFFIRKKISYGSTENLFEALMACIIVYESNKKIHH